MLTIIIYVIFLILSLIFLTPLLWLVSGKIFNIENLTFKISLYAYLFSVALAISIQILSLLIRQLGISSIAIDVLALLAGVALTIWIVKKRFKTTVIKSFAVYSSTLVFALAVALFVRTFFVQAFKIPSGGMEKTLVPGDRILVNKRSYMFFDIGRNEIIVFKYPKDKRRHFVKRVVGLPGERLEIKSGKVYIDDVLTDEPFITVQGTVDADLMLTWKDNFGPVDIPEEKYFVLGDNRRNSLDSRSFGFVDIEDVIGRAFAVYWSEDFSRASIRLM